MFIALASISLLAMFMFGFIVCLVTLYAIGRNKMNVEYGANSRMHTSEDVVVVKKE